MEKKLSRAERRKFMREIGRSGEWQKQPISPEMKKDSSWLGQMDRAWVNDKYCVMARTITTAWGRVDHACIRNTSSTDIPWRDKQKIKNELWGQDYTAIEVFPTEGELVDVANMYHLWIFKEYKLPFTLKE